jgi:Pretoxin HINT domain
MKPLYCALGMSIIFSVVATSLAYGQLAGNSTGASGIGTQIPSAPTQDTLYQEIERGPHHSVFERVEYETTPGTPVTTASGEKPIEQIKAGDLVWSWDELTGEFELEKVVGTHVRQVGSEVMVRTADETITATLTHPFRVANKGWVQAGDLQAGDQFISLTGDTETVTETTTTNATALVYNFEVENTHTYFVGQQPILVHNSCAWAKRSASIPDEPGIYVIRTKSGDRYVGRAQDLYDRLVNRGDHDYQSLIEDPNNELFTMKLDTSKLKGSTKDALAAAEDFYIKALGAKRTNPSGLNARFERNPGWVNNYFQQNGFPPMGDPVAH